MNTHCDERGYERLRDASDSIAGAVAARFGHELAERACASRQDIEGHARTYAVCMALNSLPLWLHHLGWAKACMMERGLDERAVGRLFELLREEVSTVADGAEICSVFDLGMKALPMLPSHVKCSLDSRQPYADVVQELVSTMLEFNKLAVRTVIESVQLPPQDLYVQVIGPAMYRIGELWQATKISSAQEHFCSAMTSELLAELRSDTQGKRNGRRVIAATIEGERHDLGLRMVSDAFDFHGWVVLYLGADVPVEDLVTVVIDYEAEVVAVSVSMTQHMLDVRRLATAMASHGSKAKLLVGGQPLQLASGLHRLLGAHATASTPEAAVTAAREALIA